jgi:hypothetical protein
MGMGLPVRVYNYYCARTRKGTNKKKIKITGKKERMTRKKNNNKSENNNMFLRICDWNNARDNATRLHKKPA